MLHTSDYAGEACALKLDGIAGDSSLSLFLVEWI